MSKYSKIGSPRTGAYTVEFAVVVPLVFFLFFAGIEFARMHLVRHVVDNAAYEAARHVIVPGATVDEAVAKANAILASIKAVGAQVVITPNPITEETKSVSVKVILPCSENMLSLSNFSSGLNMVSETKLYTERSLLHKVDAIIPPPPPPPPPEPDDDDDDDDDDDEDEDDPGSWTGHEPCDPGHDQPSDDHPDDPGDNDGDSPPRR